jgi:ribose 5-phosphate isomerase B
MNIIIGSDHAGFALKETCKAHLESDGTHQVRDIGVFSRESSDYPKIAHQAAQAVSRGEYSRGILICGSGIGMSMVANRYRGVRAALCHNIYSARLSRLHNDANILAMGERVLGEGLALEILDVFLQTGFEGGRHKARIDQFEQQDLGGNGIADPTDQGKAAS